MIEGESIIKEKATEISISAIAIADLEGNLVYVNPSFLRMWGYDDEKEVLGNTAVEFWQMQEQAAKVIQTLRDTGSWVGELTATRKDGSKFGVQLSASMVTDEAGNPINMMGSFVDITEKKQLEHDLRECAKELSCHYSIASIAAKEEATFDDLCQGVVNLLSANWSHSEIACARVTINGSKFETENYRDTEWKQSSDINVRGEKVGIVEIGYLKERPELDEGPFKKEEGLLLDAVAKRLGSIVEQEQAEQALQQSEERLRLILNSTPDAIIYTDSSRNILDCNPSALTMFGFSAKEELVGKSGLELLDQEMLPKTSEGMQRVNKQGCSNGTEYTCKTKDGREFPVEVSAGVVYSHTGEPTGVVAVVRDITERKQAGEALRESEERLRLMFESVTEGVTITDLNGNIIDTNDATARLHGCDSRQQLVGRSAFEFIAERDHARATENLEKTLTEGHNGTLEYTLLREDGSEFPGELVASLMKDATGNPVGFVAITMDITERKRAEQALEHAAQEWRITFDSATNMISVHDKEFKLTRVNKSFADTFHMRPQELIGRPCYEIVHRTNAPVADCPFMKTLATKKPATAEFFEPHAGIHLMVSSSPVLGKNGEVISTVHITNDITEQKQASEKLRESEARYRALFETKLDGMIVIDETTKILLANQAFADMLGFDSIEEIYEINLLDYVMPEFQEWAVEHITVGLFQDDRRGLYEIRCMKKNGDEIWVSVTGIKTEYDGKPVGIISARDITEGKQAEQAIAEKTRALEEANVRLREVDCLKSNFLSSISHELRTPLNSIIGFTSLILDGMTGDINEEQKEQLTLVKGSSDHLLSLVNDILDISKIEAGRVELSLEEFPLNELVSEVVDLLTPTAQTKGIELIAETDRDIQVYTDRRRFKQVLINLAGNAVKFAEQGSVRIVTGLHQGKKHAQEDSLEVHVIDTGIGIRKEDINKLFAPFQQVDGSLTRRFEGTGLGLHHSKIILTMLGGDIWVKSRYSKGSDFALTLPLRYRGDADNEENTGSG